MLALVISTSGTCGSCRACLTSAVACNHFIEVAVRGRFAIAGEGDVGRVAASTAGVARNFSVEYSSPDSDQLQRLLQFLQHLRRIDKPRLTLRDAVHLAVDAVEIADLVRVQIDPDRDASRPPAQDRIDEAIRFEVPFVLGEQLVNRHAAQSTRLRRLPWRRSRTSSCAAGVRLLPAAACAANVAGL